MPAGSNAHLRPINIESATRMDDDQWSSSFIERVEGLKRQYMAKKEESKLSGKIRPGKRNFAELS